MRNNHRQRVDKLAGKAGLSDDDELLPVPAIVALLNTLKPNGDDGGPLPDKATYEAACRKINPRLRWLSYAEMCEVWAESGRAIVAERAKYAAAAPTPGVRIGDRVW